MKKKWRLFHKTTILIAFALSFTVLAHAQVPGKGRISGKVIDSLNNAPVDFATVSIFKIGSGSPMDGLSTDPKGNFSVSGLPFGEYRVTIGFIGYKTRIIDHVILSNTKNSVTLGAVSLTPLVNQLHTVTVSSHAKVVENKIDKLVYNAENDLTAQGGAALDVLKKVPMVTVGIDGTVELQGSSGVRFLINGKPSSVFGASLSDALQAIPANEIKNIEVITSPGAKYDAQGSGGIINIVLKSNKFQGINGMVNLSAGSRVENGSASLNLKSGNFGIGLFFSGGAQLNTRTKTSTSRTSFNHSRDTISRFTQDGTSPTTRGNYRAGINLSWSISPKDEISASLDRHHFYNHTTGQIDQQQQRMLSSGHPLTDLFSSLSSNSRLGYSASDISVSYKKTFKKEGQELNFLYDGSYGSNNSNASQLTGYPFAGIPARGTQSNSPGKDYQTELSLDYTHPLAKNFVIETGLKYVAGNLSNSLVTDTLLNDGRYINNALQSYGFNNQRRIYAGYLSTSFSVFKDFISGKAGLRYERTTTTTGDGTIIKPYNTFAPSFTIQHMFGYLQSIKFSYAYRIERPDYRDLNPFFDISDPHNISTGNPFLKPEIGKNFELGYNKSFQKGGNIYVAAFYKNSLDNIQYISTYYDVLNVNGTDYTAVSLSNRFNLGSQKNIGMSLFASIPVTSKFELRSNIQMGERRSSTPGLKTVSAFAYKLNMNMAYQFPQQLSAEVFANYNSAQKNIQSTRPGFFSYSFAIRKQLLEGKGSVGLTAANPFSYYIRQRSESFASNFNQQTIRWVPSQSFGITFTYKFGKLKFDKDKDKFVPQMPDLGG